MGPALGDRGGLDAEEPAELDLVGIEILAVNFSWNSRSLKGHRGMGPLESGGAC